jgi:two-component system cell cycle sensor histidine kinase/response regulator CckA
MLRLLMVTHSSLLRYSLGLMIIAALLLFIWPGLVGNLLTTTFGTEMFMPHKYCYLEVPSLVMLHFTTDTLIGISYTVISITLAYLVHRARRDIPFHWIFLAFGLFIVACGATHFMEVLTLWKATYWLAGYVKLITAVASLATAVVLPFIVRPTLLIAKDAKRSAERKHELETANRALEEEIIERKRAEAKLDVERRWIRTLFEQLPVGVLFRELDGRYTQTNQTACRILGLTEQQLVGMRADKMWGLVKATELDGTPLDVQKIPSTIAIHTEQPTAPVESLITTSAGEKRRLSITAAPLADDRAKLFGAVTVITDITEQYTLQEQLRQAQKVESIGVLAGGVAHDFNNLLTAILGYSQLSLKQLPDSNPLHRNVREIKKAAERATTLTAQLLAFSRKQILQPKIIDLNETVSDISKMLRRLIGEDIDLVTVLHSRLERVKADPSQIEQVIMNLAVNARDAMPAGGKLTIETANIELDENYARRHISVQPGSYVMLAVSDTGTGMTPEIKERIFEPFFTTKGVGKGTGLGLSTVYGIVKQSGGNVWVYSEEGQGTTFKVYLPRMTEDVEAETATEIQLEVPQGNEVVLLVEDEELVRNMTRETLGMNGYHVLVAANGEEAIKICEEYGGLIHLMLTDVVMPQMSGKQLSERSQPLRPAMRVLFMSGYTDNAIVHHGVLDEGTNFIQKPFTPDRLARKVREVLDEPHQS